MVDYKLIGQRLKKERAKNGYTQEFCAEKIGITVEYLSKIENGHVKPTIDLFSNLCDLYGADIGIIFNDVSTKSEKYQHTEVNRLFESCKPSVRPIAVELLKKLSEL